MDFFFCRYECGCGLEDHCKDPNHMRSIKHSCLAHFSIKRFLHNPNVVEIDFYHQIHTQTNEIWFMVHVTWGVHSMNVGICSTCVSQVKRFYMDPIKVGVHHETNI
jgi:hypothetical protein